MKNQILTLMLGATVLATSPAFAMNEDEYYTKPKITKISSLTPIELILKEADSDILVIFDVTGVLITTQDQIRQLPYKKQFKKIWKDLEDRLGEAKADELLSIVYKNVKPKLVEDQSINLFTMLHERKTNVLFLSACDTGPWGEIPSLEDWRINELKILGIDPTKFLPGIQAITFDSLVSPEPGRFPGFKDATLLTCHLPKGGDVLKKFLHHAGLFPKKIIFTDKEREQLESVEAFCKNENIEFIGFEFTAITEGPKAPLNEERVQLQFKTLEEEHKWLSDEEADIRLKEVVSKHELKFKIDML